MIMKTRGFVIIASLVVSIITSNAFAVNLMDVYKQALSSDPKFKAARSQWLTDRETLSIKRAALFPQLGAQGNLSRAYTASDSTGSYVGAYGNTSTYSLNLTQPIFHFGDWANIWQAQALAKKAEVTFLAAAEDLLLRTAKAYFAVLQTKDVLSFAKANRESLERTLNQTKHKYDVGLIAITDLENAKADYDNAIAEEIAAINDLSVNLEKLSEITGIRYLSLDPVKEKFPLLSPQPANIERWAKAAEQQNFDLAAARYTSIMAREDIKIQNAGHLPTLDANGGYTYSYNGNPQGSGAVHQKSASAGLALNLPIFQGGAVLAQVKQANYKYQKALSDQETKHRETVSSTRQSYLTVLSNISQIKARKQAIKSAQSSLRATIAGYEAGTRTMVEVLQDQADLYKRQKDFTVSEYTYITQLLTLKQLTGILDVSDLEQINSWLEKQKLEKSQANNTINKNKDKPNKKITKSKTKPNKVKTTIPTLEQQTTISSSSSIATIAPQNSIDTKPTTGTTNSSVKILAVDPVIPTNNITNATPVKEPNS